MKRTLEKIMSTVFTSSVIGANIAIIASNLYRGFTQANGHTMENPQIDHWITYGPALAGGFFGAIIGYKTPILDGEGGISTSIPIATIGAAFGYLESIASYGIGYSIGKCSN
jgi:hypothetical protein